MLTFSTYGLITIKTHRNVIDVMVRDITPMNADLKRPYVISAAKRNTLRRHAKKGRYQIHGSYTY
jgi:hypothetical protein